MILDNETLVFDDLAYNASAISTPVAFDLGRVSPGPGERIKMFLNCNGGDMAGLTGVAITDCATVGGSYTAVTTIDVSHTELNAGTLYFSLPAQIRQFVKFDLTGTLTAGTGIIGGVHIDDQTNL